MKKIILSTGLAIAMMASPFFIQASDPQRIAVSRIAQAALAWQYPGLKITTDELPTHLYKPLVKPYYLSGQAQAAGFKLTVADSAYIRRINKWKAIKYKAELYDSALVHEVADGITDADIRKYYDTHTRDYKKYAVATFIQGVLNPGHESDTNSLKQEMRALASGGADKGSFKKGANEKWSINMEQDVTISPQTPLYPLLSHSQKDAIVCGKSGSNMACYMVLNYIPETAIPIENVQSELRAAIKKEKTELRYTAIAHQADSLIPLRLDIDAVQSITGKDISVIYGAIGTDTINKDFLTEVQGVNPHFHFSQQPDAFIVLLRTYVSTPEMKARLLKKMSVQDSLILDRILSNTYDSKLAEKYEKAEKEKLNQVPEAEIQAYYASHQNLYAKYGLCAYLKAELIDSSAATIAQVKKEMLSADTKQADLKIKGEGRYVITNEGEHSFDPSNDLYTVIKNTPLHTVSTPVREWPDAPMHLILPYRKDEPKVKPLDEVRELCRQAIASEKLERYNEKLKADVFSRYIFVIE
ncbi:MAG: hypothetical protein JWO03_2940 [Bacteroidetes bacterium]|nr:hypothetical protein [Bacteroidota bacterium]